MDKTGTYKLKRWNLISYYILGANRFQPHGVDVSQIEGVGQIIDEQPQYHDAFRQLFAGHLAQSTHAAYDWILTPFRIFCSANGKK